MDEIPKFWRAVRTAVQDAYRVGVYTPDTPLLARDEVRAKLADHRQRWFHLEAVAGYDESQLPFLSGSELARLRSAVERFRLAVPSEADGLVTATPLQQEEAGEALADICGVLDFYRYRDWPALNFGKQIEQKFKERFREDHAGVVTAFRFFTYKPADNGYLYLFALLSETGAKQNGGFLNCTRVLHDQLSAVADEVLTDNWDAIIRFRYDAFPAPHDPSLDSEEDEESILEGSETG